MEIVKESRVSINKIVEALKRGKIIVYPTETCYGLGCDAVNKEAVDKIFKIKRRQKDKTVLVLVSDIHMIAKYIRWTPKLEELSRKYWPGPLTVVADYVGCEVFPNGVVNNDKTIAFRVTDHPFASRLCRILGKPIVSTSANIATHESPYDIRTVAGMFENNEYTPDIIIDAGALSHHAPSTIVKITRGKLTILRQGEIVLG